VNYKAYSKQTSTLAVFGYRILDIIAVLFSGWVAYIFRFQLLEPSQIYINAILLAGLLTFFAFPLTGIYHSWREQSISGQMKYLFIAWTMLTLLMVVIGTLSKTTTLYSRNWMGVWYLAGLVSIAFFRIIYTRILHYLRSRGWNRKNILIVGAGELGVRVARHLKETPWAGLKVMAYIDDDVAMHGKMLDGVKVIGGIDEIEGYINENRVDEAWIILPLKAEERVKEILHELRHSTLTIRYMPDIFGFQLLNHSITEIAGLPIIDLSITPMVGVNRVVKALEDRILSLFILVLVSPLLLIIATGVKLSSPGPVLFKQVRHGWDGKPIRIYKFRTMVAHTEDENHITQAVRNDPRVTKFGSFLRRTSLDELPQFINVLQGRMSIVGPRPHAIEHTELYKDQIDYYMKRHKVKPGITGWAQVNGWRGETDTLDKMQERIKYDLYYIENWSLWLDLKIIFLTLLKGFVHEHAY
jgi:putative colanic acid biosynthesis UDP-glucose lipid carrier transferase